MVKNNTRILFTVKKNFKKQNTNAQNASLSEIKLYLVVSSRCVNQEKSYRLNFQMHCGKIS